MKKNKKKNIKLLKGEKLMYTILITLIVLIPIINVFTSSLLSETNTKLERLKTRINEQTITNQNLGMQIDELASLDNIKSVAEEYGLSYVNGNIKSISEE